MPMPSISRRQMVNSAARSVCNSSRPTIARSCAARSPPWLVPVFRRARECPLVFKCTAGLPLLLPNGGPCRMSSKLPEESMTPVKQRFCSTAETPGKHSASRNSSAFLDGQTTNRSLIAKNPEVKKLVASERGLSVRDQMAEYRKSLRPFRLWSETREFRLKCSQTRILRRRRCSIRPGRCSRGFLMPS